MTDTRQCIGFGDVERFLVINWLSARLSKEVLVSRVIYHHVIPMQAKSYNCITGGRQIDVEKYGPYVDAVRDVFVPSLDKQIIFCLERFVYNDEFRQSSYLPYLKSYKKSMLTAYAKYNEIGTSVEAMRDLLTLNHLLRIFASSLLMSSRLNKIGDDLDAIGVERNWLGHVNVLNYINEKDFWLSPSTSSRTSRQCSSSICLPSDLNITGDSNAERSFNVYERTRGYKRPRKRTATHINGKHYKLERLAQLSDRSFRVTESLYNLLKSNWDLQDSLCTKRKLKRRSCDSKRSSSAKHRGKQQTTDWKNENLLLVIKTVNGAGRKIAENENRRNSEVRTHSALPLKVDQLLSKLERVMPLFTEFHCSFIQNKFQTKVYNVCSCLNNLLSRLDGSTICSVHLVCEIRKDSLTFKLRESSPSKCGSCLFIARIMTCEALYRYGMQRNGKRRNKLESQSFWVAKKANEISIGRVGNAAPEVDEQREKMDFAGDEVISSIKISFNECGGNAKDQENTLEGLTDANLEEFGRLALRDSLSINDVVQKLELSPFRLEETEHSFKIRSQIRDIVRSIMLCTPEPKREEKRSVCIQAIVSRTSSDAADQETRILPLESKPSQAMSVPKIEDRVSLIESKILSSKSKESCSSEPGEVGKPRECAESLGSVSSKEIVTTKCRSEAEERCFRSKRSVKPNGYLKLTESPVHKAKPKIRDKSEIRTNSAGFIRSRKRPLSKQTMPPITSKLLNAVAKSRLMRAGSTIDDGDEYDISVTVEIEDSSQSSEEETDAVSRHTHVLPSMKTVKLGTSSKYFPYNPSSSASCRLDPDDSSSSRNEVLMHDKFTTMNRSMMSSSNRGTISTKSYDRIKQLIRDKVCKKFSDTESCEPNSSKTIVSGGKYYLSIPSSKINGVRIRHEISESSSASGNSLRLPVRNFSRQNNSISSSNDEESVSSTLSNYHDSDSENCEGFSRAATIDKDSSYGCVEDRLVNRYLRDIVGDYSDETRDSPGRRDFGCQIFYDPDDCGLCSTGRKDFEDRYQDSDLSSDENEGDEEHPMDASQTNVDVGSSGSQEKNLDPKFFTTYIARRADAQRRPGFNDYEEFRDIKLTRRPSGWSTCAIRSSSPREIYPNTRNFCSGKIRERSRNDPLRQKVFSPLNIIEKYKKRFRDIDKSFRAKLSHYVDLCKNAKSNLQKHIRLDAIYPTGKTSQEDYRKYKYTGNYFGG